MKREGAKAVDTNSLPKHGKVIAERDGREWLVLMPNNEVFRAHTKAEVLKRVRDLGVGVTVLEWRP